VNKDDAQPSRIYKEMLHAAASENLGSPASSEDTDRFGQFLLGQHRAKSKELVQLKIILENFLQSLKIS
jgi:hypothetical protein